jgi:hypothetical protein
MQRESRHGSAEREVLKEWVKQIETDELVKSAVVLSPKVYDACATEESKNENATMECELREAVRAAQRSGADTLVFARTGYLVPAGALQLPILPHKPAEIVTYGALLEVDAGNASMLRYERASVALGNHKLSETRVRSIEGFLHAVSNSLVENADVLHYTQRKQAEHGN